MRPCISIRGLSRLLVGSLVGRLVGNAFVQIDEKWSFTDSKWFRHCWTRKKEGRGGRRDEEEGGTRRKEGRGGRMDAEKGATWRKERWGKWKNEKVASGRIVDLRVLFWTAMAVYSNAFINLFNLPISNQILHGRENDTDYWRLSTWTSAIKSPFDEDINGTSSTDKNTRNHTSSTNNNNTNNAKSSTNNNTNDQKTQR